MSGLNASSDYGVFLLINTLLIVLVVSVAVTDLKSKKIYNLQTYPAMICGLFIGLIFNGLNGIMMSAAGIFTGIAILFLFFLAGGIGAGDVKLLGAIGALKGPLFVIYTIFYTSLVGGAVALAVIIWSGTFRQTWLNVFYFLRHPISFMKYPHISQTDTDRKTLQYIPYGFVISVGSLWALFSLTYLPGWDFLVK